MKLKILGLLLLLSGCVNIADHYGVALCGDRACEYKDYEGRRSAILDTKYDYDHGRVLSSAIIKSVESCLIGYAIIYNHFPKDQEVFDFHWKNKINADYILYVRLETNSSFLIDPPFKFTHLEENGTSKEIALIYFYVEKKRAISCYNPKF